MWKCLKPDSFSWPAGGDYTVSKQEFSSLIIYGKNRPSTPAVFDFIKSLFLFFKNNSYMVSDASFNSYWI